MNKITIYIAYHYYIYSTLCCSGERTKQYSTHIIYLRPLKIDLKKDMTHKTDLITEVSYQIICTIISNLQDLTKSRKFSTMKKKTVMTTVFKRKSWMSSYGSQDCRNTELRGHLL